MTDASPDSKSPTNAESNRLSLLSTLAQSGNQWVQFGTLALIALTGFGNWISTWKAADTNRTEIVQGQERIRAEVIRQVKDIHDWIESSKEEFHQGNLDAATNKKTLVKFKTDLDDFEARQMKLLENQGKILETDTALLQEMHSIAVRLAALKRQVQMRGAPP